MDEVKFLYLPKNERKIAYRELGCLDADAKPVIALHGMMSSSLGAIPGIKDETLKQYGIRLVSLDRPGYGQSDPWPWMTFRSAAEELEQIIDALHLGPKVMLVGLSMGGSFCWAAARFIPHRISAIAMWAPVGNFFWKGISSKERGAMLANYTLTERVLTSIARWLPFFFFKWLAKRLSYSLSSSSSNGPSQDITKGLSAEDWNCLKRPEVKAAMTKDYMEALKYHQGFGVAKDLQIMNSDWGFEIDEIAMVYKGKIHIWQGDKDKLVPLQMQRWVQKQLPNTVVLHELHGEGHISWCCFNDAAHHETLKTLLDCRL